MLQEPVGVSVLDICKARDANTSKDTSDELASTWHIKEYF